MDFFRKVGEGIAKYKECDKRYLLGSEQPKFQTVTGLKNRLANVTKTKMMRASKELQKMTETIGNEKKR